MLLASFGTFWSVEGLGVFRPGQQSVAWPGSDAAILVLIVVWFLVTRVFIAALGRPAPATLTPAATPVERSAE